MLLKGKGSGGMAPPFLQFGGLSDSEEELKLPLHGSTPTKAPIPTSIDSDDGNPNDNNCYVTLKTLYIPDRSSVSLSDLPINPPPPDMQSRLGIPIKDDPNLPLSTPPSPFLSSELYHQCHRIAIEQATLAKQREALETTAMLERSKIEMEKLGSDISSSEDELLTGGDRIENHYSPLDGSPHSRPGSKNDKDDDRMSLSSLSSGDQKIEEQKPDVETALHYQHYYPGTLFTFSYT